jgi:hypothetical protein
VSKRTQGSRSSSPISQYEARALQPPEPAPSAKRRLCPHCLRVDFLPYMKPVLLKVYNIFTVAVTINRFTKLNSVAIVRERTGPTERPPLVGEVSCQLLRIEGVAWSAQRIPTVVNLGFLDRSRYFFLQVAPQLSSRG